MKRGTTPTIPIKINMPFDNVERVEFIFKPYLSECANTLLHKVFDGNIPIKDGDTSESFTVELDLTAEETMQLYAGDVYMDTRIVLTGNIIPATQIVKVNITETLFRGIHND